jgi:hypothetical protein
MRWIIIIPLLTLIGCSDSADKKLICRNGKLYEVSCKQTITIFTPTYDDCEVKQ